MLLSQNGRNELFKGANTCTLWMKIMTIKQAYTVT